jgi:N6-adenosine-specific RNA methylase IME4
MPKYQIIYADPPWAFTGYVKENKSGLIRRFPLPYPTLTDKEIMALPIKNILMDDAILFLWCVDSRIGILSELMRLWGFKYKTVGFIWNKIAKTTNGVNATYSAYTRKSCEFLYIGTKGKGLVKYHGQNQYFPKPKTRHSEKPQEFKEMIVKMCGDLPRIELFARQKTEGWDSWGNEVENNINLNAQSKPNHPL